MILHGSRQALITACLVMGGVTPFALFASVGHGYLLPLGLAILTLMIANLVVVVGWGEYFPWAIPMLYAQEESTLAPSSYWIVFFTSIVGMIATYVWWQTADQNR